MLVSKTEGKEREWKTHLLDSEHNQEDMTDGDNPNSHSVQSYWPFPHKVWQTVYSSTGYSRYRRTVEMVVDTGAAISLMNEAAFRNLWGNSEQPSLRWSPIRLTTYTDESIQAHGSCDVTVTYGNNTHQLQLLVVPGDGPTFLRQNWLDVVKLIWEHIHRLQASKPPTVLQHLLARYPDVFKDELGTLKGFITKLNVGKDVNPIFCKARPVPLALQEKVDAELARLEKLGIIESVQYSNWAAPVVPVVKADK